MRGCGENQMMRTGFGAEGLVDDDGARIWVVGFEDHAEAQEGVHLVQVAADLRLEAFEFGDVGVD